MSKADTPTLPIPTLVMQIPSPLHPGSDELPGMIARPSNSFKMGEEGVPSLAFACVEITRGDKESTNYPIVIWWYVELLSSLHAVAEMSERWFINGHGRPTSRVGASDEDRVSPLHMEQVRDMGCIRRRWFRLGYLDPGVVIYKPSEHQYQTHTFSQRIPNEPAFSRWEGLSGSGGSEATCLD